MNTETPRHDYLVISRGHWDKDKPKEQIDTAITEFYDWLYRHIEAGRMRAGSRLGTERANVSKAGITTDGPFGEAKEVVDTWLSELDLWTSGADCSGCGARAVPEMGAVSRVESNCDKRLSPVSEPDGDEGA